MLAEEPSPITTCSPWLSGVKGRSNARANLPDMKLAEAPVSSNNEIAAWWTPAFTLRTCEDAIDCSTQRLLSASTNTRNVLEVGGSRNSAPMGSSPVHKCVPGGEECTSTGNLRPGRLILLSSLTTNEVSRVPVLRQARSLLHPLHYCWDLHSLCRTCSGRGLVIWLAGELASDRTLYWSAWLPRLKPLSATMAVNCTRAADSSATTASCANIVGGGPGLGTVVTDSGGASPKCRLGDPLTCPGGYQSR
jgi:hypothetical protein